MRLPWSFFFVVLFVGGVVVFIGCGLGVLFGGCEVCGRCLGWWFLFCVVVGGVGFCRFWVVFWVGFLVWGFFVWLFGCGGRGFFATSMLVWLVVVVGVCWGCYFLVVFCFAKEKEIELVTEDLGLIKKSDPHHLPL